MANPRGRPPGRPRTKIDTSMLSADRIQELKKKAAESVAKETVEQAEAQLLEQYVREARQMTGIDERMRTITLDLAPHSDRLVIDNVVYMHGSTYEVPESMYRSMKEMMQRGWEHQSEIEGKPRNHNRKQRNLRI